MAVSKTFGRSETAGYFHKQRIKLPRECLFEFAKATDGDDFFHGKKFIQYPDGSVHMHVELLCKPKDGFCPSEVAAPPYTQVASGNNLPQSVVGGVQPMDTSSFGLVGGATVLHDHYSGPTSVLVHPVRHSKFVHLWENDFLVLQQVRLHHAAIIMLATRQLTGTRIVPLSA